MELPSFHASFFTVPFPPFSMPVYSAKLAQREMVERPDKSQLLGTPPPLNWNRSAEYRRLNIGEWLFRDSTGLTLTVQLLSY
jgi:hypothetical protein